MRKLLGSATALLIVLGASSAIAQPKGKGKDDKAKVKTYDFSGDEIEGSLIKPDGSNLEVREFAKHGSLIRIRTNFIAEILKSAEDL